MSAGTPVMKPVVKLRPSDAHRWLVCRAAPGYCAQLEAQGRLPQQTFAYTEEGITAHDLAAKILKQLPLPKGADRDMVGHVRAYAEYVLAVAAKHPGKTVLYVEHKVEVYYSDRFGYVDACVVVLDGNHITHIYAIDLKYGRGVSVEAEKNPQLAIYLKSLLMQLSGKYKFSRTTKAQLTIWQPRVTGEKAERTWKTHVGDLENFCTWIDEVAKDIQANPFGQSFEPSDEACQFCPAAPLCDHRARDLLGVVEETVPAVVAKGTPEFPEVTNLTHDQIGRLLKVADPLRAWLEKVEAYALAVMQQNNVKIPGQKLVRGRTGNRKWTNPAQAQELFSLDFDLDDVAPRSLISPSQMETLLKEHNVSEQAWADFEELVSRSPGKVTLAPEDDERPALDRDAEAAEHFEAEGEELL